MQIFCRYKSRRMSMDMNGSLLATYVDQQDVATRIRQIADWKRISLAALCAQAGVSRSRLNNAMSRSSKSNLLRPEDCAAIAVTFEVTMQWIYIGDRNGLPFSFQRFLDSQ